MATRLEPLNRIREFLSAPPQRSGASDAGDGLRILEHDAVYTDDGVLDYLWFRLRQNGETYYKAVCLNVLTYLPIREREVMTVLEKTRKVVKGIYTAQVDMVYLAANITDPPMGIVQLYGVQGTGESLDEAVAAARRGMGTVKAVMANFEQSRLAPVDYQIADWIRQCYQWPFAMVLVGHPDPRDDGAKGMSDDDPGSTSAGSRIGLQQNEYLFRGMVQAKHPFLSEVLISRMGNGDQHRDIYRMQERVAQELSIWASKERFTRSMRVGMSIPVMLSGSIGDGTAASYATGKSEASGDSVARSLHRAHTEGRTKGEAWGRSHTEGETHGHSTSSGQSWSRTAGVSETRSIAQGVSRVESESHGVADGTTRTQGSSHTSGGSSGVTRSNTASQSGTLGWNAGGSVGAGPVRAEGGVSGSTTQGTASTVAQTSSSFSSRTSSQSRSQSHVESHQHGIAEGQNRVTGHSITTVRSSTRGGFSSSTDSHSRSSSDTESYTRSEGQSEADTHGLGLSWGRARSRGINLVRGQSLSRMHALGLGAGVAPSISAGKTWQGEDHVATMVADALREQMRQLQVMAKEGGVYVDHYVLCPTPEARDALEALTVQAFHGTEDVVTPVRPRRLSAEEQSYICERAMTFTPSTRPSRNRWVLEPWRDTTLLTMLQAATYVAPGAFEHGLAVTVQEAMPPFAVHPNMPGKAVLGHQFSHEINHKEPTDIPVRLDLSRVAHWAFCGDTGTGKSIAAERLVYELVLHYGYRVIVLDFGEGWRRLLTALPEDLVDFWSLAPGSPHPIRWNPLQVGQRIAPQSQMEKTTELLCNAGRLGQRQHYHMLDTLQTLYQRHGVLTFDDFVQEHSKWGFVQSDEAKELGLDQGEALVDLPDEQLQELAVHRSKVVDLKGLISELERLYANIKTFDDKTSIGGAIGRLRHLVRGRMGKMYGQGEGSIAIGDFALPRGVVILEAGLQMNHFAKAALLSLMGWQIYADAKVRRGESLAGVKHPRMMLFLEEGNKIVTGVAGEESHGSAIQSEIWPSIFRDSRRYDIDLGIALQSPSEMPGGILSSCANLAAGQQKSPADIEVIMGGHGRSSKGFHDVRFRKWFGRAATAQFGLKLGRSENVADLAPMCYRPLMLQTHEPSNAEIRRMYQEHQDFVIC